MRPINRIVIHCSYTKPTMDIGADEIRQWHTDPKPKGNGWNDIGYHYVIRRGGQVEVGRDLNTPGAHAAGFNEKSIGVCLVGGMDADGKEDCNFTQSQWRELRLLVSALNNEFPEALICGHRDLPGVTKPCPTFDAIAWWNNGD